MSVKLTASAAKELHKVIEEQKLENPVVRIGIEGGGCSGFQYSLGFDEPANVNADADTTIESEGLKVVVDKKSMLYLDGTTLDFYEGLEKRGFVFDNPNATKGCGCGKSFQA